MQSWKTHPLHRTVSRRPGCGDSVRIAFAAGLFKGIHTQTCTSECSLSPGLDRWLCKGLARDWCLVSKIYCFIISVPCQWWMLISESDSEGWGLDLAAGIQAQQNRGSHRCVRDCLHQWHRGLLCICAGTDSTSYTITLHFSCLLCKIYSELNYIMNEEENQNWSHDGRFPTSSMILLMIRRLHAI